MRRLAVIATGGALWLFLLAVPALADNGPHVAGQAFTSQKGSCASCHRAHSAEAADLVRMTEPLLCESCHGSGTAGATTDVVDGVAFSDEAIVHGTSSADWSGGQSFMVGQSVNGGTVAGALRGGGFKYALIYTNLAAYTGAVDSSTNLFQGDYKSNYKIPVLATAGASVTSTHSVDDSTVTIWGYGPITGDSTAGVSVALECTSCHDPHGNRQYRLLRPNPSGSFADTTGGTYGAAAWVYVNDVTTGVTPSYTTTNYGVGVSSSTTGYWTNVGLDVYGQSKLNADGTSIEYSGGTGKDPRGSSISGKTPYWFSGTWRETNSRWCATCHTRYFAYTGAAGNKTWTEEGSKDPYSGQVDPIFTYRHAIRNVVDPATSHDGSWTFPITNLSTGSQSYTSGDYFAYSRGALSYATGLASTGAWIPDTVSGNPMADRGLFKYSTCTFKAVGTGSSTYSFTASSPTSTAWVALGATRTQTDCTSLNGTVLGTDLSANTTWSTYGTYPVKGALTEGDLLSGSGPMCMTCHIAHGTNATTGDFITDSGMTSNVTGLAMDSALLRLDGRQACEACHSK